MEIKIFAGKIENQEDVDKEVNSALENYMVPFAIKSMTTDEMDMLKKEHGVIANTLIYVVIATDKSIN